MGIINVVEIDHIFTDYGVIAGFAIVTGDDIKNDVSSYNIRAWCAENLFKDDYEITVSGVIYFFNEEAAIAFKLRWM